MPGRGGRLMQHEVVFSASALDDLRGIYDWIFDRAGPDIADAYLERVESACRSLGSFPLRGTPRDELTAGLRTIAFERRAVIAYTVDGSTITIRRVLYGGRDLPAALGDAWGCDGSHWEGWRRPPAP